MSAKLEVQSEIFKEDIYITLESSNPFVSTSFRFKYPDDFQFHTDQKPKIDEEGDLIVDRRPKKGSITIEHSLSTPIETVGLQVWRGALLLADFILHNGQELFYDKNILEVGAGMGLSSIVASMFAKKVFSTDLDVGGILQLLKKNFKANESMSRFSVDVKPLDFFERNWSSELETIVDKTDYIIAADVIYDNDVTKEFVKTLEKMLSSRKTIYICLEKRYVFTIDDLDSVAPCYEYFLKCLKQAHSKPSNRLWIIEELPLDFPQYFQYDRCKHLVLWKISKA